MTRHDHTHDRSAHDRSPTCRWAHVTRRRFLVASGVGGATAFAGCTGGETADGEPPAPVSLAGGKQCDTCGMVIAEHPGPAGQIFYRDHGPEAHDGPAWFDSLKGCLFPYYFEHRRLDWSPTAVYVTDYSSVEYEVTTANGHPYIETTTAPETFANAEEVGLVVGSEVYGAMGPDFVPFSDDDDASAFVDEYGGRVVGMADVTPDTLVR